MYLGVGGGAMSNLHRNMFGEDIEDRGARFRASIHCSYTEQITSLFTRKN